MKFYKVTDHEPSILPDGDWEMTWSDEFDGTELDRSKWDYRMSMMQLEHPAWTDEGVEQLKAWMQSAYEMFTETGKVPEVVKNTEEDA